MNNFLIGPTDTDSISFCKPDGSVFTESERKTLLKDLNDISPEYMIWEDDGLYEYCIALKAKNYVLYDGKKLKYKGSALIDQKKEPALMKMLEELLDVLLERNKTDSLLSIYNKYVIESQNIKNISRWATKKTITEAIFNSERKNETKVKDAIFNETFQSGDKIWIYPAIKGNLDTLTPSGKPKSTPNRILKLTKNWEFDEDKDHYLKRIYSTITILKNVIDMTVFPKYQLKKYKTDLDNLLNHGKITLNGDINNDA